MTKPKCHIIEAPYFLIKYAREVEIEELVKENGHAGYPRDYLPDEERRNLIERYRKKYNPDNLSSEEYQIKKQKEELYWQKKEFFN